MEEIKILRKEKQDREKRERAQADEVNRLKNEKEDLVRREKSRKEELEKLKEDKRKHTDTEKEISGRLEKLKTEKCVACAGRACADAAREKRRDAEKKQLAAIQELKLKVVVVTQRACSCPNRGRRQRLPSSDRRPRLRLS